MTAQAAATADFFAASPAPELQFIGTLTDAPVERTRSERGRPVQVLCIRLHDVGPQRGVIHAEMPFTDAQRKTIEALAHSLRPGQRVAVTAPIHDLRLTLPRALSISPCT